MALFACNCLNVKIHVKEDNLNNNHQTEIAPKNTNEVFFTRSPVEVELDVPGVIQEHPYLIHKRQIGEWILYQCLVCDITTHAKTIQPSARVLVSQQLQHDSTVIERLKNSSDFSPAFHIILQSQDPVLSDIVPDPMSRSYESLQSQFNSIQQHLSTFLLNEKEAMEARISAFEEEQRNNFIELQTRVKRDKKNVISLLLAAAKIDKAEKSTSDASKYTAESGERPVRQSKAFHQSSLRKPLVSRTKSLPVRPKNEQPLEPEAMFVLDDELQQDSDVPFYNSGCEEDEDDEDTADEGTCTPPIYSSSVPVTVPRWTAGRSPDRVVEDHEQFMPADPDQMAASMQALAQSITDDERYIFGDRPRPRLNTGDFTLTKK